MKGFGFVLLVACQAPIEPEQWQLDDDRAVAVRVTPPRLLAGEHARIEGLLAHADGPTTINAPGAVVASPATSPLALAVNFVFDHWEVIAPDEPTLVGTRSQLGLAEGEPIPFEINVYFGTVAHPIITQKVVWFGNSNANPALPAILIAGVPPADSLVVPRATEIPLLADADKVSWLTSCGTLRDSQEPDAILRLDAACTGELAVVVRDREGGTVWKVWPIATE
ncbi:hypothetical protein BH11MYX1_BH11MYX1_23850 [soil metagenome]